MPRVGGFTPYSTIDYPGYFAAVVFFQGCPWRCRYCHNPHLLPTGTPPAIEWDSVMKFLERRQGLLDAVVFSGGEPTLQKDMDEAVCAVKALGFKVGLHTAGIYPERLRKLLPQLDWIGMDVKMPFSDYERLTGVIDSGKKARTSTRWILDSGVDCEFRTTVHSALLSQDALDTLGIELAAMGVQRYVLQEFRRQGCPTSLPETAPDYLHCDTVERMNRQFQRFSVRNA